MLLSIKYAVHFIRNQERFRTRIINKGEHFMDMLCGAVLDSNNQPAARFRKVVAMSISVTADKVSLIVAEKIKCFIIPLVHQRDSRNNDQGIKALICRIT